MSRAQLLGLGFNADAIAHRVSSGRLHPLWPGVFAVGSPNVSPRAKRRAATMTCGPDAWLSAETALAQFGLREQHSGLIDVSVPLRVVRRRTGIRVHRRRNLRRCDVGTFDGLPVTSPLLTFVDVAARLPRGHLEAAMKEADVRGLITPAELRAGLAAMSPRPGVGVLTGILDRDTFVLTDSELERLFVPLALAAGLPKPIGGESVLGFDVDFYWPKLGIVAETDGLRYHRTPAQQARDRRRDQALAAAGLVPLRFTHGQVKFEGPHVTATLVAVASRLRSQGGSAT